MNKIYSLLQMSIVKCLLLLELAVTSSLGHILPYFHMFDGFENDDLPRTER